jgi:hypothetical protein
VVWGTTAPAVVCKSFMHLAYHLPCICGPQEQAIRQKLVPKLVCNKLGGAAGGVAVRVAVTRMVGTGGVTLRVVPGGLASEV